MLGFRARPARDSEALAAIHPGLPQINDAMVGYDVVTDALDAFVQLAVPDLAIVYRWRLEAEHALAAHVGRPCMSDADVHAFVDAFMPAYRAYLPALAAQPPCVPRALRLVLTPDRTVAERWTPPTTGDMSEAAAVHSGNP